MNTENILLNHEQNFNAIARVLVGQERQIVSMTKKIKKVAKSCSNYGLMLGVSFGLIYILEKQIISLDDKISKLNKEAGKEGA